MACDFAAMRFRVTLQRATNLLQPGGEQVSNYSTVGTYWAQIINLAGREQWYARQVIATCTHKVFMRNVGPITAEDRLLYTDVNNTTQTLNIGYVSAVDNLNEAYELLCTEQRVG